MQQTIQFETVVEKGIIRIPDEYVKVISAAVTVTLAPLSKPKIKTGSNAKAGTLSSENFKALKIDTTNFKFDREEANER